MADIEGDANNNNLSGTSGQDTIKGLGGNDTIDGGAGNDIVSGGDGDDVITGGAGDDVIVGGRGNDTLAAGSSSPSDTFVIRDGDGNDVITDFDPPEPDIISFHMDEITVYQDILDRMSTDGPDTVITFDNGDSLRLQNVSPGALSPTNFQIDTGPVCFHAGTFISTATGSRRVEDLCPGDLIRTADNGDMPVRQIVRQSLHFHGPSEKNKPILIKAGSFAPRIPNADLVVSPQHRIMIQKPDKGAEILVAACKLIDRPGIRRMFGRSKAVYYNLLFENHEIIYANGCPLETLLLTPYSSLALPATMHNPPRSFAVHPARPIVSQDPARSQFA